jgi:predicted dehydrogenase
MKRLKILDVVACADLLLDRAEAKAKEFGVPRAVSVKELLADPEVRIVLNLTIPRVHYGVAMAAVRAGKSVYNEKPLCLTRAEGRTLLAAAKRRRVLVGCAPDTFYGPGHQTCRRLIDRGAIGTPVAATAFFLCPGHESWHPSPEFYYKKGGGPMLDMGPYYLTALVNLLGPIARVTGSARKTHAVRTITSKPLRGNKIRVDVPTHVAGVIDFACGAVGTIVTSFDVWSGRVPALEVYGTKGSLAVPHPNTFGNDVFLRPGRRGADWKPVRPAYRHEGGRGYGVADMARALLSGSPHRASGELAYHVLDVMHAFTDASRTGRHVRIASTCARPAPLPVGPRESA